MTKIFQLPDYLIRQIAAGEVIAEPLSVIKEAIENSLDAEATDIQVDIKNGGNSSIIIADNGVGISREDLEIITTRHSTSKIKNEDDLLNVLTLGFRGEFLASLLVAADLTIITKDKSGSSAFKAFYSIGNNPKIEPTTRTNGTSIIVTNLFDKLPARRSFLPKPTTSITRIHELVRQFSLAYSTIRFSLISDNKELFRSQPGNKINAIVMVLGQKVAKNLLPIHGESGDKTWKLEGFISKPVEVRSNRSNEFFFVNGRIIENLIIQKSLEDGYSNFLASRKFPIAIFYLTANPEEFDANVHPAKKEIRIKSEKTFYEFIKNLVYMTLTESSKIIEELRQNQHSYRQQNFELEPATSANSVSSQKEGKNIHERESFSLLQPEELSGSEKHGNKIDDFENEEVKAINDDEHPLKDTLEGFYDRKDITQFGDENFVHVINKDEIKGLEPVIQLDKTVIVAKNERYKENLYFIDQHAVSERITLEKMLLSKKKVIQQSLLQPIELVLNPEEFMIFSEIYPLMKQFGYSIEKKTGLSVNIYALPVYHNKKLSQEQLLFNLREILSEQVEFKKSPHNISEIEHELEKSIACHNSIRAGDALSHQEMKNLLIEMNNANFPYVCCHGRPSIFRLPIKRIYKLFWRI